MATCVLWLPLLSETSWRDHVRAHVAVAVIVISLLLLGCARTWLEELRMDDRGVAIRNFWRTCRFGWSQVSCLADGASAQGNWELKVLLRNGQVKTARATNNRSKEARSETLTAIGQATERYGVQTELHGVAIKYGLYADPDGQPGVRYWNGIWSPLLP